MEKRYYLGDFDCWVSDKDWDSGSVVVNFQLAKDTPEPELIWAVYGGGSYDGSAEVIYRQDGKWYHVNGSHCSCYGLAGQWEPESFDPQLHFQALEQGKRIADVQSSYYSWDGSSNERFDDWLRWAVEQ